MSDLLSLLGNLTFDAGGCPEPFISESLYPYDGGFKGGRNCAPNPLIGTENAPRCCIPCPVFDWTYADDFKRLTDGAAWVNVTGFILCGFLLLTFVILPRVITRPNYLNITLLVCIMLLEIGFIIPLARQPSQCYDAVTPNGMHSNITCAFSGAFVAFGLMATVCWITARALFMHLQICWSCTPGRISYVAANIAVWSVTIGLTAGVLAHSGVSYRFGGYCQVNVGSISTYWGWLLGFGGVALILQLATFAYCIKVFLTAALLGRQELGSTASSAASSRKANARAAVRRVREVLVIQWRSLAIVALAIFTTAFVCIVFIVLDNSYTIDAFMNTDSLIPWILCILETQDKNQCLQYTGTFIIPESIAIATLFILGFVGVEAFFLLCRWEIFPGWLTFLKSPFRKRNRRRHTIDMFGGGTQRQTIGLSGTTTAESPVTPRKQAPPRPPRPEVSERRSLVAVESRQPTMSSENHLTLARSEEKERDWPLDAERL